MATGRTPALARAATAALLIVGGAGWAVACGPSVAAIYEGNVRFEHCYRLDLDPSIAPSHREACWREWAGRYTYGQTRDRLEYAKRRIAALSSGDTSRPALRLAANGEDAGAPVSPPEAPAPTNLHAPPPPTAQRTAEPAPVEAGVPEAGPGRPPPKADCVGECRAGWSTCATACDRDAGTPTRACKVCDTEYRWCVQRCFR